MQLYGEIADHFKLSECKLAIIHCAGHSDPILVHSLWQEIMEKGKLHVSTLWKQSLLLKKNMHYTLYVITMSVVVCFLSRAGRHGGHESS